MTRIAVIAGALAVSMAGIAWLSWEAADSRAESEQLRDQVETDRRIDDADIGSGDADDDRDWLRDRSAQ